MKSIFRAVAMLMGVAVTFAVAALLHAQPGAKSGSVVKVTAKLEHPAPGKDVVVVHFDVQKPWHIYANPVGNADFASSQTSIKVLAKGAKGDLKQSVDYPAGKVFVLLGEKLNIYDGSFDIRATVEREAGATGALEAVVRISACDDKSCLLPEAIRIPLP
jgi:DsbC/DsbD-like thiol-disulfide interchange protein